MIETPVLFGPGQRLLGVVTMPSARGPEPLACLMLNFGVTHRIGPHRLNVKLARRLAGQGVPSIRFDLSGIGDSAPARGASADFREQAVADMKAALDHVEATTGIRRFVVFGLCSGAVNGYLLALADTRVAGLMMFDGFAYPTLAARLGRNWHRLRAMPGNPAVIEKTARWLKRALAQWRGKSAEILASDNATPAPAEFERAMETLIARGVSIYFVYSGTLHDADVDRAQLGIFRGARFMQDVAYDFMADVDHTVTPLAAQRKFLGATCRWVSSVLEGGRPSASHAVQSHAGVDVREAESLGSGGLRAVGATARTR